MERVGTGEGTDPWKGEKKGGENVHKPIPRSSTACRSGRKPGYCNGVQLSVNDVPAAAESRNTDDSKPWELVRSRGRRQGHLKEVDEDIKSGPGCFSGGSFHLPGMLNAGMVL